MHLTHLTHLSATCTLLATWPHKALVTHAELGCRLVVVLGGKIQIDNYLNMRGLKPKNIGGYRITDDDAMLAAMEAAGTSRMLVEAQLSKVQAIFCCLCSVLYFRACLICLVTSSSFHRFTSCHACLIHFA